MADDGDIEIVHEEIIPLKPGVPAFVRQQIHLLKNLKLNNNSWIPTNYKDFLECVKSLKTNYQSDVILATWKLLLDKHLSTMVPEDLKSKTKIISALGENATVHHKGLKHSRKNLLKTSNMVFQNKNCANIPRNSHVTVVENIVDPPLLQTVSDSQMLNSVEKNCAKFKNFVETENCFKKKPKKESGSLEEIFDKSKLKDLNRTSISVENNIVNDNASKDNASNVRTSGPKQNHSLTVGLKPNINDTTLDNITKPKKRKAELDNILVDKTGCKNNNSKVLKKTPATSTKVGGSEPLIHNSLSKNKRRRTNEEETGISCDNNIFPSKTHKKYIRKISESDFITNSDSLSVTVSEVENEVNRLSVSCPEITSDVNNSLNLSFESRRKNKRSSLKLKKKEYSENTSLEELCTSVLGDPYKKRKSKSKFKNIYKSVYDSGISKSKLIHFLKKQNEEKLKEEEKLEKQMLEAYHERLIDVIIPKYCSLNKS